MLNYIRSFASACAVTLALTGAPTYGQPLMWTPSQPLNDYAAVDGKNEMASWSASNGQGTIVTIFKNLGGLAGSRSLDGGQTWSHVFASSLQGAPEVFDADVVYAGTSTFVA